MYEGVGCWVRGLVFRVSGFGFQVSGFEVRVSSFGFWVSGFGCLVSGVWCRALDSGLGVEGSWGCNLAQALVASRVFPGGVQLINRKVSWY